MAQEIEIEFKNLLTEDEFKRLSDHFHIQSSMFIVQDNFYFDSEDFKLKDQGCALRIRLKNEQYEMTLKEPLKVGLLETSQIVPKAEAKHMLSGGFIIDGPVKEQLQKLQFPIEELQYFGSLLTKRAEIKYKDGLLVLDNSSYLNLCDYELEYEVNDLQQGEYSFKQLLDQHNIPVRITENKIRRFYNAKYEALQSKEKRK